MSGIPLFFPQLCFSDAALKQMTAPQSVQRVLIVPFSLLPGERRRERVRERKESEMRNPELGRFFGFGTEESSGGFSDDFLFIKRMIFYSFSQYTL